MEETKTRVDMEEITRAAKATYEKLPEEEKKEIEKMFGAMDRDGDGKISVEEFKTYFERKGDHAKVNSNLFNLIDRNGDGNLGLDEVLTLFYISESGRPVCVGCGNLIQALFFTCTYCHYSRPTEDGYSICIDCYEIGDLKHDHMEFLDNYTLFAEMKKTNGGRSAQTQVRSPDFVQRNSSLSSSGTLSSTGIDQPRTSKRDSITSAFKTFIQWLPGAASGMGLSPIGTADTGEEN